MQILMMLAEVTTPDQTNYQIFTKIEKSGLTERQLVKELKEISASHQGNQSK